MDAPTIIRQARHRGRLTQQQLAARSGVPQSVISLYESGAREPGFRRVEQLVTACGERLTSVRHPHVDELITILDFTRHLPSRDKPPLPNMNHVWSRPPATAGQ